MGHPHWASCPGRQQQLRADGSPNQEARNSQAVAIRIAEALGVPESQLCGELGQFFQQPEIKNRQPNNLRGHAFRSIVAAAIDRFGPPEIHVQEEQSPFDWFPGFEYAARGKRPRIDILVSRRSRPVALITTRWIYRHDRVDIIEEALAYMPAARRVNGNCRFYGVTAEFTPSRLKKVLSKTGPGKSAPIDGFVHLNPELAGSTLGRNGELETLRSLDDLFAESTQWA